METIGIILLILVVAGIIWHIVKYVFVIITNCVQFLIQHWAYFVGIPLVFFVLWALTPLLYKIFSEWLRRRKEEKQREEEQHRLEEDIKMSINDIETYLEATTPHLLKLKERLESVDSEHEKKWAQLQKRGFELLK